MAQLFNLYDRYNKEFFDGTLPFVDIVVQKLEDAYGYTYDEGFGVYIELANDLSDQDMHDTLLHEMVHVWQIVTNRKLGHGRNFKRKAKTICKATGIPKKRF
jgi:hypothetical protein